VEFSNGVTKLERFLPNNQNTQRKFLKSTVLFLFPMENDEV
jgi:hypothetical protein